MTTLSNEFLTVTVENHGAELSSIRKGEKEYLWQADPQFWARHSPVLFPIVGAVWNGQYQVAGKSYKMGQHGFARDMEFELLSATETEAWWQLKSTPETLLRYPYEFVLEIGYRLHENQVDVMWRVANPSKEKDLFFQIGAHPAFYWPEDGLGYFRLSKNGKPIANPLSRSVITDQGCVDPERQATMFLDRGGLIPLSWDTFAQDALIFPLSQVHKVELLHMDQSPYLSLEFEAPLVGLWSPPGKHAPFVCIEPWYGRCDSVRFAGEYAEREHVNRLGAKEVFEVSYTITVE